MVTKKSFTTDTNDRVRSKLPDQGVPEQELFRHLEEISFDDVRGHWSTAFRSTKEAQDIGQRAYQMFLSDNGIFSLRIQGQAGFTAISFG